MDSPSVYDHVSPTDTDYPDGIYRVVGTDEAGVTLLRVGDADARRVTTGAIGTVRYADLDRFEPAGNPDGNRPLGSAVSSGLEMIYWSLRVFGQQMAAHPLATAFAFTFLLGGYFGEGLLPFPEVVLDLLIIIGSLGLAFIGSGRL